MKVSRKKQSAHATPAEAGKLALWKAGKESSRLTRHVTAVDVIIAAMNGSLPVAHYFIALADDETFAQIRRTAVTLTNAVVISRRLRD
jgi:hypothetical protein